MSRRGGIFIFTDEGGCATIEKLNIKRQNYKLKYKFFNGKDKINLRMLRVLKHTLIDWMINPKADFSGNNKSNSYQSKIEVYYA